MCFVGSISVSRRWSWDEDGAGLGGMEGEFVEYG